MSDWALMSIFSPSSSTTWSSARKTRNLGMAYGTSTILIEVERDAQVKGRAGARLGLDVKAPADERRALPHPDQPELALRAGQATDGIQVEAAPVVFNNSE